MLDKVSTEIQGLPSTDCNFQGLSRCVRTLLKVNWGVFSLSAHKSARSFSKTRIFFLVIEIGVVSLPPPPTPAPPFKHRSFGEAFITSKI